jgi:hypothetical protein
MGHARVPPALTASRMGERPTWTAVVTGALPVVAMDGIARKTPTAKVVFARMGHARVPPALTASRMVKRPTLTAVVTGALPVLKVQPVCGTSTVPAVCVQEGCVPRRAAGMVSKTAARRTLTVAGPAVNPVVNSSGARKIPTAKVVFARMGHASVPPALTRSRMMKRPTWTAVVTSALDARLAPGVIGAETASLVHVQRVSAKLCDLSARMASRMVKRPTWTAVVTGALPVLKVQPVSGEWTVPAVRVQEGCVPRRAAGMVSKTAARRTLTVAGPAVNPVVKSSGARKIPTAKVVFARMAHASVPPALTASRMVKRPTWTAVVTGALDARLAPGVIGAETASLVHVQRVSAKLCDLSARTASKMVKRPTWTAVVTGALPVIKMKPVRGASTVPVGRV